MNALIDILGGVGLFLFGMAVMTSGLRKLAGDRLRGWLAKSTKNPVAGALTGATVTALIQSSSATTVMAIGFVGAGLMSFTASLGIIFGANLGTTITGWMVALLGFKLKLADAAMPLVFVAALCYMFKRIRPLHGFGKALAGFCLIFIGISYLQGGLEGYRDAIDLSQWRAASFGGRIVLVLIGIVLTLITQSSSATVATALTALSASILDLPQTAAVIIGADIGTTATAALATIGGTTASRRTGFAHVLYNLLTGLAAFFFLPIYLFLMDRVWPGVTGDSPEVVAVGFHSLFNGLGVVIALPFTKLFGQIIERIFPERTAPLVAPFDDRLLEDSQAAIAGLEMGTRQLAVAALRLAGESLQPDKGKPRHLEFSRESIVSAIEVGRDFAVKVVAGRADDSERVFACIHLIDHIERLAERSQAARRFAPVISESGLKATADSVGVLIKKLAESLIETSDLKAVSDHLANIAAELEGDKPRFRKGAIQSAATNKMRGDALDAQLDAHRWLRRMTYHAARIGFYSNTIAHCHRSRFDT